MTEPSTEVGHASKGNRAPVRRSVLRGRQSRTWSTQGDRERDTATKSNVQIARASHAIFVRPRWDGPIRKSDRPNYRLRVRLRNVPTHPSVSENVSSAKNATAPDGARRST